MNRNDYKQMASQMKVFGLDLTTERLQISIPDAENVLRLLLAERMGNNFKWLPEYSKVAEWMTDNNGRGLLLMGNVGRGKTEIGRNIMPAVINHHYRRIVNCYDAVDLSARKSEFLDNCWPLCIDDLGTERDTKSRDVFERLADQMEKRARFLIVTTNLSAEDIRHIYGDRVFDRLKGNTTCIVFKGDSMRG
jgi:DNA replication protein DnaC